MGLLEQAGKHLGDRIRAMALVRQPFDHIALQEPFDPQLYPEIVANLPGDEFYRDLRHDDAILPNGRSARWKFDLLPANIDRLSGSQKTFWQEMARQMKSLFVEAAYREKFTETLEAVTGRRLARIRMNAFPVLFRDVAGYKINIHPDSRRKALTTQYYLPEDDTQLHLGTLMHERLEDGTFREARAMTFAPNSGYAFAVNPESWHSVRQMRPDDRPRNSLMIIFYYDRGVVIESLKRARGFLRGWYDQVRGVSTPEVYDD